MNEKFRFSLQILYLYPAMKYKRELDKWGDIAGEKQMGLEGAFDRDKNLRKSMAVYSKGVFKIFGWYKAGGNDRRDWKKTGPLQREINRRLRRIVGADNEHSLCVVEQGTMRGSKGTFSAVEYYAKCGLPTPETVQECSRAIQEAVRG